MRRCRSIAETRIGTSWRSHLPHIRSDSLRDHDQRLPSVDQLTVAPVFPAAWDWTGTPKWNCSSSSARARVWRGDNRRCCREVRSARSSGASSYRGSNAAAWHFLLKFRQFDYGTLSYDPAYSGARSSAFEKGSSNRGRSTKTRTRALVYPKLMKEHGCFGAQIAGSPVGQELLALSKCWGTDYYHLFPALFNVFGQFIEIVGVMTGRHHKDEIEPKLVSCDLMHASLGRTTRGDRSLQGFGRNASNVQAARRSWTLLIISQR
jgi:hypothetical protein